MNIRLLGKENKIEEFYIDSYLNKIRSGKLKPKKLLPVSDSELFLNLCQDVQSHFENQWNKAEGQESKILERQT
ncbi:unnamed protein product, partial [marine sediment metagenome]